MRGCCGGNIYSTLFYSGEEYAGPCRAGAAGAAPQAAVAGTGEAIGCAGVLRWDARTEALAVVEWADAQVLRITITSQSHRAWSSQKEDAGPCS